MTVVIDYSVPSVSWNFFAYWANIRLPSRTSLYGVGYTIWIYTCQ